MKALRIPSRKFMYRAILFIELVFVLNGVIIFIQSRSRDPAAIFASCAIALALCWIAEAFGISGNRSDALVHGELVAMPTAIAAGINLWSLGSGFATWFGLPGVAYIAILVASIVCGVLLYMHFLLVSIERIANAKYPPIQAQVG